MIDIEVKDEDKYGSEIKKCKSGIKHIKNGIDRIKDDIDGINTDICILRGIEVVLLIVIVFGIFSVIDLRHQLDDANTKIESMQVMKDDISSLESDLSDLKYRVSELGGESSAYAKSIRQLNENQQYMSKVIDNIKSSISKENSDE